MESMNPLWCQKCLIFCGKSIFLSSQTAGGRFSSEKIISTVLCCPTFEFSVEVPFFWMFFLRGSGFCFFPWHQASVQKSFPHCWTSSVLVVTRFFDWITRTRSCYMLDTFRCPEASLQANLYLKLLIMWWTFVSGETILAEISLQVRSSWKQRWKDTFSNTRRLWFIVCLSFLTVHLLFIIQSKWWEFLHGKTAVYDFIFRNIWLFLGGV